MDALIPSSGYHIRDQDYFQTKVVCARAGYFPKWLLRLMWMMSIFGSAFGCSSALSVLECRGKYNYESAWVNSTIREWVLHMNCMLNVLTPEMSHKPSFTPPSPPCSQPLPCNPWYPRTCRVCSGCFDNCLLSSAKAHLSSTVAGLTWWSGAWFELSPPQTLPQRTFWCQPAPPLVSFHGVACKLLLC